MIVVNFKRYPEASGVNAVTLAKICLAVQQETGVTIIPTPQAQDLVACTDVGIGCWSQRFEAELGVQTGTLLNHSDYRLERRGLQEEFYLSQSRGDKICLCSASLAETKELLALKPGYLAYEPPALIGSKTNSVAQAEPEIIGQAALACKAAGVPLLVGAGIKSAEDVRVSLKQGALGILVASAVVQAANQEQQLRELAQAFK